MIKLAFSEWSELALTHREILNVYTEPHLERRTRGIKDPVFDFLFSYYTFSVQKLLTWHPGAGVELELGEHASCNHFLGNPLYVRNSGWISLDEVLVQKEKERELKRTIEICNGIISRPAAFSCFGMHEWAMLYKTDKARHSIPLRLPPSEIDRVVEEQTLRCTHFDAFRFYTAEARPLNRGLLSYLDSHKNEQGGCIHANMDLYKMAYSLSPLIGSDLLRECFLFVVKAREIDMRATPYDLRPFGFEPICVETAQGKIEYVEAQKALAQEAIGLRRQILDLCKGLCKGHRVATNLEGNVFNGSESV